MGLLHCLLLPFLQQAPPRWLLSWFQRTLPALHDIVSTPHDPVLGSMLALTHRRAAWLIIELMYKVR